MIRGHDSGYDSKKCNMHVVINFVYAISGNTLMGTSSPPSAHLRGFVLGIAKAIARDSCMCKNVSAFVTAASHTHVKSRLLLPHLHLTQ